MMSQDSGSDNGAGSSSSSSSGDSEKLSNKRSPNWSDFEIRTLCEFVKKHKAKLFGLGEEGYKKGVNAAKKKHWELAAALINEKCATDRHWSQVRKKWKDLSYNARKLHESSHRKGTADKSSKDDDGHVIEVSEMDSCDIISSEAVSSTVSPGPSSPETLGAREFFVKTESIPIELEEAASLVVSSSDTRNTGESRDFYRRNKEKSEEPQKRSCCLHSEDCPIQSQHLSLLLEKVLAHSSLNCTRAYAMSTYEKARLEIEKEKYELQRTTAKCLRDILKEMRQISATFCRNKRRRKAGDYFLARKRRRWRSESESSVCL